MDKTEARKKITDLYDDFDGDNFPYEQLESEIEKVLDNYANSVSRERAIRYADAFHNCISDKDVTGLTAYEVYDKWWNKVKPPDF